MDDIMIALCPTTDEWCEINDPHMTLVYCGKTEDRPPTDFNRIAKDAMSLALISRPISVRVTGVGPLGPPDDIVAALMLKATPELRAMRTFVDKWDTGKWPDFVPHCTIGPYPIALQFPPSMLTFNRIMVGYGEDQLYFSLT